MNLVAGGLPAAAASVAAGDGKSGNGGWGLLVVALLAVAIYFLFRSMTRHLRKAQQMDADKPAPGRPAGRGAAARRPPSAAATAKEQPPTDTSGVPRPRKSRR
jgi:MYXO-CTERM domain-containing protein